MSTESPRHFSLPVRGPTLTVKVVVLVAVTVALFMAGFRVVLHDSLEATVRAQLQSEAINAARTAAQSDLITWTQAYDTIDEGLTADQMQARADSQTVEQFQIYRDDPVRLAQIEWNSQRLGRVLGTETRILAMQIFRWSDGMRGPTVAAAYPGRGQWYSAGFSTGKRLPPVQQGRGEAQEGTLSLGDESWHVMRGSYPILGRDGEQQGEVAVFIDAGAIAEAAEAFGMEVLYAGLMLILLSVIVAYLLARVLTGPMRRLRDDARAVIAGDLEHHTRPHSTDEVGQLARTFESMRRWLASAQEAELEAEEEAQAVRRDLEAAADVTASLFPATLPAVPGWSLGGLHDRKAEPGGGIYDVLTMPDGKLGLFVAEASSGGAPGALVSAMTRPALQIAAERASDPGDVLREAARRLASDLSPDLNAAVVFVVIDPATGATSVASAGHRPVLHYRAATGDLAAVLSQGEALGVAEGEAFGDALVVAHLKVQPGDSLVVFASAISLLSGPEGEVLGEKRLAALVKQAGHLPADQLVDRVGAALRKYHGGESLGADVTLVAVGREGA